MPYLPRHKNDRLFFFKKQPAPTVIRALCASCYDWRK
jgi:hypothetical protein